MILEDDIVWKKHSIYDIWNIMFVVFKGKRTLEKRSKQAKDGTKRTLFMAINHKLLQL